MIKYQYTITVNSDKVRTYECRNKLDVFQFIGMIDGNMYRHFGENWLRHATVCIDGNSNRFFYDRKDLLEFASKMLAEYYKKEA